MNSAHPESDYSNKSSGQSIAEQDAGLLQRVAASEERAFAELYQRYEKPIFHYIFQLVRDQHEAEDLLQEVFLAVWKGAHRFRGNSSVKTWIFRIAHNQAVSHLRQKRLFWAIDDFFEMSDGESLDETIIANWQNETVWKALEQLSAKHRAVIELTFVHELAYADIAKIVGCPVGTVKSRVSYALQAIKRWQQTHGE